MTIHIDEDLRIPMADGVTLSARLWRPADAVRSPVPAIVEYIPYRKRDHTRARDETLHRHFAGHGYVSVRVDLRGSGESGGILGDEYCQQELDDGYAVVQWLADQPWCDGRVGMIGISWGGFNGLQIAAMRPPALKAIVTVCSSDDRYADDVHYMGGCLLGDNLSWASVMFAYNSLPPDPALRGADWRAQWHQRLEANEPWLIEWLSHQHRDAYWQHGSVCEDYKAIECPVMAVSGWADGYTDAVFRLLEHLHVPRQGLIGPWSHKYPHQGVPGPAIDFQGETLRWWDRWLKGRDTGIMDEPMLRAWIQEAAEPATRYRRRPGRWVGVDTWPSDGITERWLFPARGGYLTDQPMAADEQPFSLQSPLSLGLFAGKWCSYSVGPDLPYDQREEDGGALVFETAPLTEAMELLGAPRLRLCFQVDRPVAQVAARLSDVAPDGKATRVTYGVRNLNHTTDHADSEALTPGTTYTVEVDLNHLGHRFFAEHRLRLSLSTSYWPLAWPPPEPVNLSVIGSGTALALPVCDPSRGLQPVRFASPPADGSAVLTQHQEPEYRWRVHRDLETSASELEVIMDEGEKYLPDVDLTLRHHTWESYRSVADEFDSIEGEVIANREFHRDDWRIRTRTRTLLRSDAQAFYVVAELDAWEGEDRVFSRNWQQRIPRADV
jgi:hypothetical protein